MDKLDVCGTFARTKKHQLSPQKSFLLRLYQNHIIFKSKIYEKSRIYKFLSHQLL